MSSWYGFIFRKASPVSLDTKPRRRKGELFGFFLVRFIFIVYVYCCYYYGYYLDFLETESLYTALAVLELTV